MPDATSCAGQQVPARTRATFYGRSIANILT